MAVLQIEPPQLTGLCDLATLTPVKKAFIDRRALEN
jgi:hypothetical protein